MAAKILKLLCVFFSVLTVLLCGCEHNKHTSAVKTDFSADFSAEYRGLKLSGSLVNTRQGYCAIELSAPKTLEGLSVTRQDNELSIARGGVKATADESYLPSDSFYTVLHDIFEAASDGSGTPNGDKKVKLALPLGEATIELDDEGYPAAANMSDNSFSITFLNSKATDK